MFVTDENPLFVRKFLEAPDLPKQYKFWEVQSDLPKLSLHGCCRNTVGFVYLDM